MSSWSSNRPHVELGQIWELAFPFTDTTEFKRRPTVVVAASPMGPGEDQVLWVAMVTKEVRHKTGGDIVLPQSSRRALMYPSLIRARRITSVPAEVFLDPKLTRYMGDVDDQTLTEIVHQMSRMFA